MTYYDTKAILFLLGILALAAVLSTVFAIQKDRKKQKEEAEKKKQIVNFLKEKGGRYVYNIAYLGFHFDWWRNDNDGTFGVDGSLGSCRVNEVLVLDKNKSLELRVVSEMRLNDIGDDYGIYKIAYLE